MFSAENSTPAKRLDKSRTHPWHERLLSRILCCVHHLPSPPTNKSQPTNPPWPFGRIHPPKIPARNTQNRAAESSLQRCRNIVRNAEAYVGTLD